MSDASMHRLCDASAVPDDSVVSATLPDGERVALYNVDGCLYATDDACTHGEASLSEDGTLEGHVIECGLHLGSFDVRTGEVVSPPCTKALRTYPVESRDGAIWLKLA